MFEHEVIVIGGNHHNTLGVLRALGRRSLMPHLLLTAKVENPYVAKCRYHQSLKVISNHDEILPALMAFAGKYEQKPIVIACHDVASSLLDKNQDELQRYFVIPCSDEQGKLTRLMNKQTMAELAKSAGLRVPRTWVLESSQSNIDDIEYPCITKPLLSISGSKSDICICRNKYDLLNYLSEGHCRRILVQQYIKKKYEYQYIGCSLNNGDTIVIPGVSELIRPGQSSNTGFLKYTTRDTSYTNIDSCRLFIRATGYSGLFSMEFLRDELGNDFFMEINFRNDGNGICVTNAGVNLPYIWYLAGAGKEYHSEIVQPLHDEYVMPEFNQYILLGMRKIKLLDFIHEEMQKTSSMEYDANDPAPTNGKCGLRKALAVNLAKYFIRIFK